MAKLSISQAWDESRAVLAHDGSLLTSVALAMIALPQTIGGLAAPRSGMEAPGYVWAILIVATLIGLAAQIALNRLAIGPSTSVGTAVRQGFTRMPVLVGTLLIVIAVLFLLLLLIALLLGSVGLMVAPSSGNEPPPGVIMLLIVVTLITFAIVQLAVPVAAAEPGGSIRLITRSWALGRHDYWRLLAFVTVVLFGLLVVLSAGQFVFGSFVTVALGAPAPWSLSALVSSLVLALMQAAFTTVSAVMLARIYVQLSGGSVQASLPSSGT